MTELAIIGRLDDLPTVPDGYSDEVLAACSRINDWTEVNAGRATLNARIAQYRTLGRSATELLKAERYTEVRIGELLAPYHITGSGDPVTGLPHGAPWQFRQLAIHRERVLAWISQGIDTRAGLLAKIKEFEGSQRLPLLDTGPQYQVIYVDPPWRYEHTETPRARQVENQYTTMALDELAALTVPAAPDSVLFMWATNPKLEDALWLMSRWKFEYRTNMVWVKDRIGMGYYVRGAHELLLIGKRGQPTMPLVADRPKSWLKSPRQKHSLKPAEFFEVIETMYPHLSKLEMFSREHREGWDTWGHEANGSDDEPASA